MAGAWLDFEFHRVIEDEENRRERKILFRTMRDNCDPFSIPDDKNFKKLFRLPKFLVQQLINEIEPFIVPGRRTTMVPLHLKILTTLNFVAHGGYQTTVGENLNIAVSQPVVSRILNEVTEIFANHFLPRYVRFPVTNEEIQRIKDGFANKFEFPNVLGTIDCSHVAIIAPVDNERNPTITYYNRKGYYSVNVQTICNSDLKILAINARYPGSTHDSAIWATSTIHRFLRRKYENGMREFWLLGDGGYPLQPWLITPIQDAPDNTPEGRFTLKHCSVRNTIERCFGVLKQRFRCLLKHRVLHYSHRISANIIYTCAVLHNLCIEFNIEDENIDFDDDDDEEDEDEENVPNANDNNFYAEGLRTRRRLINMLEDML